TKKFYESLLSSGSSEYELIIIDNASTDETEKYLEEISLLNEKIKVIKNNFNLGFPSAVNQGIKEAKGKYINIVNNDIVLTEGWLERLIEVAESDSRIGLVGPISNEVSGLQKDENAKYNSIEEMHEYAAKVKEQNHGEVFNFPRIAFLCTLIKKEVIEKIGGLDERFTPGNYEDDDFCLRAQLAGFKTVIAKDVFIHHYGSKSFKADGENKYAERLEINKQKFIGKWGVTPDELWIQRKEIKPHQYYYPISKNKFDEHFERARILLADKELDLALESIKVALEYFYKAENRKNQIELNDLLDLAGNLALANGEIELAQKYFAEELNIHPNSSSACAGLAEVF
ncbi:MAG: glycosyltransferase, partial [Ignavibacteria bacterium]|nr:glycosyltransferase [Ignavibacteria bacterium]